MTLTISEKLCQRLPLRLRTELACRLRALGIQEPVLFELLGVAPEWKPFCELMTALRLRGVNVSERTIRRYVVPGDSAFISRRSMTADLKELPECLAKISCSQTKPFLWKIEWFGRTHHEV